jgi:hypothetical protein
MKIKKDFNFIANLYLFFKKKKIQYLNKKKKKNEIYFMSIEVLYKSLPC